MDRRAYLQALSVGLAGLSGCGRPGRERPPSAVATDTVSTTNTETPMSTETTTASEESAAVRIETVTMNLEVPWGAAFHPDGSLYLTERPGRIRRVTPRNGPEELVGGDPELVVDLTDEVEADGEAGLLGLAVHPDDPDLAYTYGTYGTDVGAEARLVAHDVEDDFAVEGVVRDGIPAGESRTGGRLAVDSGGTLYAAVGDVGEPHRAGNPDSAAGSVLRFTADGEPHPDNPFDSAVFTYGHRNPLGLAVHPDTGAIYVTECGSVDDGIFVLRRGRDYGWPEASGDAQAVAPVVTYDPAIEPASAAFYDGIIEEWVGDLFLGTLAGRHLRGMTVDDGVVAGQQKLLDAEYGRLRTAFAGPDGHLYVTTSNRDEEGHPAPTDDRVLRIRPA